MKLLKLLFFTVCLNMGMTANAQIIGTDTALLVELVTTTASQLNELEKLVTNAEKYTKKMQEYNELTQDEYFRAQHVLYLAEALASKKEVQNLETLNSAIRDLKFSMNDLRELMKEYYFIKEDEKKTQASVISQKKVNSLKEKMAKNQVQKAINAKNTGRSTQLTAQNTALIYESNVEMHNTQLDILEKQATTNRLLAEQMEEKRKEEMERKRFYGTERGTR